MITKFIPEIKDFSTKRKKKNKTRHTVHLDKNYLLGYDKIYLLVCFKTGIPTDKTTVKPQ